MKEIELTGGHVALVDDSDYGWLNQYKWHVTSLKGRTRYASRGIKRNGKATTMLMHRLILGILDSDFQTDHIDGNGLNNVRANLRRCNSSQNNYNHSSHKGSHSKYVGVTYQKGRKLNRRWVARMTTMFGFRLLGRFKNEEEAAFRRDLYILRAEKTLPDSVGFAKLNILKRGQLTKEEIYSLKPSDVYKYL